MFGGGDAILDARMGHGLRNLLGAGVRRIDSLEVRSESGRRLAIACAAVPGALRPGRQACQRLKQIFRIPRARCGVLLLRNLGEGVKELS